MIPFLPLIFGGPGLPTILQFDSDTLSSATTSPSLTANVKPGTLIVAFAAIDAGGGHNPPASAEVNGQGSLTQIVAAGGGGNLGLYLYKYEGNTTDGAQQFDWTFVDSENYFAIGVWSIEDVPTIASNGEDDAASGATSITYTGGTASVVLHSWACDGSGTDAGELTKDAIVTVGSTDLTARFEHGLGLDITGGTLDSGTSAGQIKGVYAELTV